MTFGLVMEGLNSNLFKTETENGIKMVKFLPNETRDRYLLVELDQASFLAYSRDKRITYLTDNLVYILIVVIGLQSHTNNV